jgi:hypothetical protein
MCREYGEKVTYTYAVGLRVPSAVSNRGEGKSKKIRNFLLLITRQQPYPYPYTMTSQEDAVAMLTAMGFEASQASEALTICGGNVEQAANYLLTGGVVSQQGQGSNARADHSVSSSQTETRTVHSSMSQYTVTQGRSACTCISLVAAEKFLQNCNAGTDPVQAVSSELLQDVVTSGVAAYQRLQSSSQSTGTSSVEHLSAEEVLQAGAFPSLVLTGGIRQGILSHDDASNPQGLRQQLTDCQSATGWTCVLITKTPETVLVCLPPTANASSASTSSDNSFLLLDSHPRPHQFDAAGSYARIHNSMQGLVQSLSIIFPVTDLGPDIPEMMAIMYNSFDLYPLRLS